MKSADNEFSPADDEPVNADPTQSAEENSAPSEAARNSALLGDQTTLERKQRDVAQSDSRSAPTDHSSAERSEVSATEGTSAELDATDVIYEGEVVRPAYAPDRMKLRFGIGGAMILVTVLAFQYALVRYLGPIAAIAVPPTVCFALMLFVLIAEVRAWQRQESDARWISRKSLSWAILYIFILGTSAAVAGGAQIGYGWFAQWRLERRLQRDFGFVSSPGVVWGANRPTRKTVYLLLIEPGGDFEKAGFQNGEAVVTDLRPAEWFRMLNENRGKSVDIVVAQGAATNPLEKCITRTVTVRLPP